MGQAVKRAAVVVLLLSVSACKITYLPLQAEITRPRESAFPLVLDAMRVEYPRLILVDHDAFRIQSAWTPYDDERAGQKRASVYMEEEQLSVVVETRHLSLDLLGNPDWSSPRGHPRLERQLMNALLQALE